MTALYIIVGILLFIFLLLMIPVSFRFRYDGEPELILQYLFVRIKLVPPKEKSEKQKNESKKSEKPKEKKPEKKENNLKKLYKKRGLDGLFEILSDVISIIKDTSTKLIKHIVIKKLKIDLLIVGEDAGDTAMKYGYICSNMKLKKKQIDIEPGFTEKETKIFAETKVSIRPWFALGTIISAALRGIKLILGIKKDMEV